MADAVLIVEDDAATAELERRVLSRAGLDVRIAGSVAAALQVLEHESFAAILLDYQLPEGEPWEVVEAAKSRSPRIPVVIVTAMGNERVAAEAIQRGVAEYVRKAESFWDQLPAIVERVARLAEAEEQLRRSQALFALIAGHASDVILITDAQGAIRYVSPSCRRLFGYTDAEMIGRNALEFVHAPDCDPVPWPWPDQPPQEHVEIVYRHRHSCGEPLWIEASCNALQPSAGSQSFEVICVLRDITERRYFEQTLQQKNAELGRAVETRDRFLATMSHELRTPLTSIIGFTGALLMKLAGPLSEQQTRHLETIRRSGNHLLSLINDLLHLARIESGKITMERETIVCRELAEEVRTTLQPLADERKLLLSVSVTPDDLAIPSDRRAILQILLNLGSNAVKFTDDGAVDIALRSDGDAGACLRVDVTDTGIGISQQHQTMLFEAFERPCLHPARRIEGTGLGLYLSRTLAVLLGGDIQVSSEIGKGSTFTLRVPLRAPEATVEDLVQQGAALAQAV